MTEITRTVPEPETLASMGLFGGDGSAIEAQERRGADEMAAATHTLPVEGSDDPALAMITWGDVIEGDPLFREATLPAGWSRAPTGHDMWTYIFDEKGVLRARVFYKAAFYDRRASILPEEDDR